MTNEDDHFNKAVMASLRELEERERAEAAESALQVARDALREEQAKRDRVLDALYTAWTIIANAGRGDWHTESPEWEAAATRWRDEDFHPILQWSDRRLAPEVSPE